MANTPGSPVDQKFDPLVPIGQTGLKRFAGRIYEEFLRELQGDRWRKAVKEMVEQDPIIGAIQITFEMLLRRVSWDVQPFSDDPEDEANAEYLRECMDDMSQTWAETIAEALSMLSYGWCYDEIVYKLRKGDSLDPTQRSKFNDGRFGWRKFSIRAQDTLWKWEFDEEGGIQGMWQMSPPSYQQVFIPIDKALLFRTTSRKANPEGKSIYRNAYRPWFFIKRIENLEGIGIERDLAGMPVLWLPPELLDANADGSKKAALAAYQKLITLVKRDEQEGIIMPLSYNDKGLVEYKLELLSTGSRRQFDTNGIIDRKRKEMLMSCMADVLLLGHEANGSNALADTKTSTMATAMGSFLDSLAATFNSHAVPRLFRMNNMPTDKLPVLIHGEVENVDLSELAAYITSLAGAGFPIATDKDIYRFALEQGGFPVDQDGIDAAFQPQTRVVKPADAPNDTTAHGPGALRTTATVAAAPSASDTPAPATEAQTEAPAAA